MSTVKRSVSIVLLLVVAFAASLVASRSQSPGA